MTESEIKALPVSELNLSGRARHVLEWGRIETIGELCEKTRRFLLGFRNMGPRTVSEIITELARLGLSLADCEPPKSKLQPPVWPRKWEKVNGGKFGGMQRLKVPGGWIVVYWTHLEKVGAIRGKAHNDMIFYPDTQHAWVLEPDPKEV